MAKPVKDAKANHQSRGFTEVAERGRGYLKSRKPGTEQYALTTQVGGAGWHKGDGPFTEADEIDTAWQATTGAWQWEMTQADYQAYARDVFNVGGLFQFEKGGESVAFDPQSINWVDENTSRQQISIKQNVTGVVTDDVLRFDAAYGAGRHFEYQNQTTRLQKRIIIDAPTDLPAETLQGTTIHFEAEFSLSISGGLEFYIDGALWTRANNTRVKAANNIEVRDAATGTQTLFWIGQARAWDGAGNDTAGELEVRRQGGPSSLFITVRIPKTWIDAATFPITIDPTVDVQVGASAHDANQDTGDDAVYVTAPVSQWSNDAAYLFTWSKLTGITASGTADVAYLTITVPNAAQDDIDTVIYGEDAASPADATATTDDLGSRTRTTASVAWVSIGAGAGAEQSPSIVSIVQELLDSYSYSSGSMAFIGDAGGTTSLGLGRTYDYNTAEGTQLHLEYTVAAATTAIMTTNRGIW